MEFNDFGGQYVDEFILKGVKEVEKAYLKYKNDQSFIEEFNDLLFNYANRPSLLYYAKTWQKI